MLDTRKPCHRTRMNTKQWQTTTTTTTTTMNDNRIETSTKIEIPMRPMRIFRLNRNTHMHHITIDFNWLAFDLIVASTQLTSSFVPCSFCVPVYILCLCYAFGVLAIFDCVFAPRRTYLSSHKLHASYESTRYNFLFLRSFDNLHVLVYMVVVIYGGHKLYKLVVVGIVHLVLSE